LSSGLLTSVVTCVGMFRSWPITSACQFGPRPLLVEPDIAIGIDQSRMTRHGRNARVITDQKSGLSA
jgi:hypothetical protein